MPLLVPQTTYSLVESLQSRLLVLKKREVGPVVPTNA